MVLDGRRELSRGVLIVFEGIDGTGKTTQSLTLAQWLKEAGFDVVLLREPTDGPWGRKIRELAQKGRGRITPEEELELFMRDRREDVEKNIRPALKRKRIVVMDRYYFSSMAYQGALGLNPQDIRRSNEAFAPVPDLVIILDLAPSEALKRKALMPGRSKGMASFENGDYLEKVRKIFREMDDPIIERVDASQGVEEVRVRVRGLVEDLLAKLRD